MHTQAKLMRQELATTRLRDHPTVPPSASLDNVNAGELWPEAFCGFKGCMWEMPHGTDSDLDIHLHAKHSEELQPIADHMLRREDPDAICSVYKEAVSVKCRCQAPVAGASLDRTALKGFGDATAKDRVESLVCFCCGGVHPYVFEVADKGNIQWYQPVHRAEADGEVLFLGKAVKEIEGLLGLQTYLQRYNAVGEDAAVKLSDHETFEDWTLRLPELEDGTLLCCPEAGFVLEVLRCCTPAGRVLVHVR